MSDLCGARFSLSYIYTIHCIVDNTALLTWAKPIYYIVRVFPRQSIPIEDTKQSQQLSIDASLTLLVIAS